VKPIRIVSTLLLAGAIALLLLGRAPGLSRDICDPDVAVMAYGAQDLLAGGTIYENCVETKPPGAYLVFAAVFAVFGSSLPPVYALATFLHLLALLLLYRLAAREGDRLTAAAGAFFYAAAAVNAAAAANCPNQESWMAHCAFFGFYLLWPKRGMVTARRALAAGVCFGLAVLMKQQAGVFALAVLLWLWLERPADKGYWLRRALAVAAGAALPLLATAAYWAAKGGLGTLLADLHPGRLHGYVDEADFANMAVWSWRQGYPYLSTTWPLWSAALLGPLLALTAGKGGRDVLRVLSFLLAAMAAVISGTRFYDHYFTILTPALALAAWQGVRLLADRDRPIWRPAIAAAFILLAMLSVRMELTQARQALSAARQGEGLINKRLYDHYRPLDQSYANRYEDRAFQELGEYLQAESEPGELLFVWPYHPQLYFWADRRSPTKHYMYFDTIVNLPFEKGGWHTEVDPVVRAAREQVLRDLNATPPRFVVFPPTSDSWDRPFPELDAWVRELYDLDRAAPGGELRVFRRP